MSSLTYRWSALSDMGLRRNDNQDAGYAGPHLLVLADGMGGAAAGDLASSLVVRELRKLDADVYSQDDDSMEALAGAVHRANDVLGDAIAENPAVEGMGTTLEALLWDGTHLRQAHIGDSRSYRLRDGRLTQLNDDHTFVQSLVDEGRISPEEARVHPHRSLILRALLGRDDNDPDLITLTPQSGDRYLLCSDGLSDMVDDAVIEQTLAHESIDMAATELVRKALEGGGHDNVTVVIAEFVSAEDDAHDDTGAGAAGTESGDGTESTTEIGPGDELACADGKPQIVGAAAMQPRPPTGRAVTPSGHLEVDPEEARYAPRPPKRFRALRWILGLVIIAALLAGGIKIGYDWTQRQYYVTDHRGYVAIYRGVSADIPGLDLNHLDRTTDVRVSDLPEYNRQQVREGIEARDRDDADKIVQNLTESADKQGGGKEDADGDEKSPSKRSPGASDSPRNTPSALAPGGAGAEIENAWTVSS